MLKNLRIVMLVPVFGLLACSQPAAQSQQDVQALKKEVEALRKDIEDIKKFLKEATGGRYGAPSVTDAAIPLTGAPSKGSESARVTLVEISDYHCPFCRRHFQQTQPQIYSDYVDTGKVRHVFIHYPIDQLHPDAFRSHEAASCAAEQGKFWELHGKLFESPARTEEELAARASAAGLDAAALKSCLAAGKYREQVRASVTRMQALGVSGTPLFLIGPTPSGSEPFKAQQSISGAHPYATFKKALDQALSQK